MGDWLQIVGLFLLSSTKFLLAPSTVTAAGYSFFETLIITILGGWFGVLIFYFFGKLLVNLILRWMNKNPKKKKPSFTYTNKLIVKTKIKYGIIGLALITPVTISIPIGSIIAARYFSREKITIPLLLFSVVLWSLILTSASSSFKSLFF